MSAPIFKKYGEIPLKPLALSSRKELIKLTISYESVGFKCIDESVGCFRYDRKLVSSVGISLSARHLAILTNYVLNSSDISTGSSTISLFTLRESVNEDFCLPGNKERKISQVFFIGFYKLETVDENNFFARFFSLVDLLA